MKIKLIKSILFIVSVMSGLFSQQMMAVDSINQIKNFHAVSDKLASSGMLELTDYQYIQASGFKHVINLIPGFQLKEKKQVESLAMSYQQIPVVWEAPTLEDFQQFVTLMKSYGDDKVYVHCQLNWRAATFVYLYRVTQLNVAEQQARKDLETIWTPNDGWDSYIEKIIKAYQA